MSLSNNANQKFNRRSTGALYSPKELAKVERSLVHDGYVVAENNTVLGMRIYTRFPGVTPAGKHDSVMIYLDALNCHPNQSGTMMLDRGTGDVTMTTVWDYAKKKAPDEAGNPQAGNSLMRALKRLF